MSRNVIGIGLGSLNTVVGTFKDRVVDVVLSDSSNRQVPTVVSYNDRERNFGDLSLQTNKSNYKRTIIYPNRWLGIQKDWPFIQEEIKYANIAPVEKNGKLGFEINYKGNKEIYSAESIMGLYLGKLKNNWFRENIMVNDVCVSVPDYFTAHERKAMLEAIEISGLNCTTLINESSAISLAYGLLRLNEFNDDKPRLVGFVDMGQAKTTIFFGSFTKKLMKVISVTSERFCGAREFDYLIAEKLSEEFNKKFGGNPMKSPKIKIRLIDTIAKIRKTLTVNKDCTISIDSLMDGEDLVYNLSRDEFEKIISPVTEKFKKLCEQSLKSLLEEAKVKLEDVHSIEMVGCAVRTPIIQNIIKEVFGKEISKTLLPDEAISRGCTLFAAMNSPYFNVRNYEFEHFNPYSIILEYPFLTKDKKEEIRKISIIKRGENIKKKKKSLSLIHNYLPKKISI
jgi:molecular chaperone DnaK (HSP70)